MTAPRSSAVSFAKAASSGATSHYFRCEDVHRRRSRSEDSLANCAAKSLEPAAVGAGEGLGPVEAGRPGLGLDSQAMAELQSLCGPRGGTQDCSDISDTEEEDDDAELANLGEEEGEEDRHKMSKMIRCGPWTISFSHPFWQVVSGRREAAGVLPGSDGADGRVLRGQGGGRGED